MGSRILSVSTPNRPTPRSCANPPALRPVICSPSLQCTTKLPSSPASATWRRLAIPCGIVARRPRRSARASGRSRFPLDFGSALLLGVHEVRWLITGYVTPIQRRPPRFDTPLALLLPLAPTRLHLLLRSCPISIRITPLSHPLTRPFTTQIHPAHGSARQAAFAHRSSRQAADVELPDRQGHRPRQSE